MKRHPAADAHPDGGDLVFSRQAFIRPPHPDPDPAGSPLARDVESGQRVDDPPLEPLYEGPDVAPALPQVEHYIDHALARPMIGILPATAGLVDREPVRGEEIASNRGSACRIEGRMLDQPYRFTGGSVGNRRGTGSHGLKRLGVRNLVRCDDPLDRPSVMTHELLNCIGCRKSWRR